MAVRVTSVTSLAVRVQAPAVVNVTLKVFVPEERAALAGEVSLGSLVLIPTVSAAVVTLFQLASTALTVTVKAAPAVWGLGVPVLPVAVPGAAVSPGASNCSFTNAPAFTVMEELVLAVMPA